MQTAVEPELVDDPPMPFWEHLAELRRRLIASLVILLGGALLMYRFSGPFLSWLARPVGAIVFTAPTEAFHTRILVSLYGGFLATLPLLLHQVWLFIARAMDRRWRRRLLAMVPLSYGLFLAGVAICVFVAVPATMTFLLSFGSDQVKPLLTLSAYLGFVTKMSLAFGAVFQMPLVLYVLNRMGILERSTLAEYRRHAYLLCFIAGALMTPDVFSQVLLAGLSILLFELTLLAMRR